MWRPASPLWKELRKHRSKIDCNEERYKANSKPRESGRAGGTMKTRLVARIKQLEFASERFSRVILQYGWLRRLPKSTKANAASRS
jgi:hypothetical protein